MYAPSPQELANLEINKAMLQQMKARPCVDCTLLWHPLVMSFDHTDRSKKSFNISEKRLLDPKLFKKELEKCELVCLNCHAVREMKRDIGSLKIGSHKAAKWNWFKRLIPFLTKGALLDPNAHKLVPVKSLFE